MNILLLCDEYPPGRHGGIGTVVQMMAHALLRQGHRVVVAGLYLENYGGEDRFEDQGVPVYRFRYGPPAFFRPFATDLPGRLLAALWRYSGLAQRQIRHALARYEHSLRQLISEYNIDIVEMPEFQGYMPFISRPVAFPRLPVPVVVKLHGSLSYFSLEAGQAPAPAVFESERQILEAATAIAGVSRYTAEQTARYFALPQLPAVLYNGISIPEAVPASRAAPPLVVFTGTLVGKKGIYQLMQAWNLVHSRIPEAQLHVYGKGPVEPLLKLLRPEASPTVRFLGHRDRSELFEALRNASAAVFPSYAECFALGPMEAMAAGTAVIYTTRTSGPELIDSGVNGLLCDPDKVETLAESITTLITNPELRERLASAGLNSVALRFDINHVAGEHIRFYKSIITVTQ